MVYASELGNVGPLVKVTWNDAAQQIKLHTVNAKHPEMHLAVCETIGELIIDDPKVLILVQHWSDTDGVDVLAIPKDWTQKIEVLKECTIENSESPQE
tara:strand:- start:171 stop:464 length:294 start_codon:yes stop_codon:yes gene_type:complete